MTALDLLGQAFFYGAVLGYVLGFVVVWRMKYLSKATRFIMGTLFGMTVAFIMYLISIAIYFRDGMGPG